MTRESIWYDIPEEWLENRKKKLCPVCAKTKDEFDKFMRLYCSKACRDKYYSKIHSWGDIRDTILRKHGHKCRKCGVTPEIARANGERALDNAMAVFVVDNKKIIEYHRSELMKEIETLHTTLLLPDRQFVEKYNRHIEGMPREYDYRDKRIDFEVDHIIAITNGGHEWDERNLQVLCSPCHKIKTKTDLQTKAKSRVGQKDLGAK